MSNSLDLLKATGTVVVSDSGDFECKFLDGFLLRWSPKSGFRLGLPKRAPTRSFRAKALKRCVLRSQDVRVSSEAASSRSAALRFRKVEAFVVLAVCSGPDDEEKEGW